MTKNTRFSPEVRQRQSVWFWKVRANMTHNGRQFVPLLQRLAVHRRLCVSGYASMSGIPEAVMEEPPPRQRQRLKELERETAICAAVTILRGEVFRLFCEGGV